MSSMCEGGHREKPKFMMNDDIGIRLYRTAVEARADRRSRAESIDFSATINDRKLKRSLSMKSNWTSTFSLGFPLSVTGTLEERYQQQQDRLALAREKAEEQTKRECPFRPRLSEKSARLARRARSVRLSRTGFPEDDKDIFAELYRTQLERTATAQLPSECTFRPYFDRGFRYTKKKKEYLAKPVTDRLISSKGAREETLKKRREEKEKKELTVDEKTGQRLFRPVISRGPKKTATEDRKPLHDRLYKDSYLELKKAQARSREAQRWQGVKAKTYSMQQSDRLLQTARKKKCAEVFKLLDPDGCGTINSGHIRLECRKR